jgi:hypothetical protein
MTAPVTVLIRSRAQLHLESRLFEGALHTSGIIDGGIVEGLPGYPSLPITNASRQMPVTRTHEVSASLAGPGACGESQEEEHRQRLHIQECFESICLAECLAERRKPSLKGWPDASKRRSRRASSTAARLSPGAAAGSPVMDTPQVLLEHYLKQLRLPTMMREYRKLGEQHGAAPGRTSGRGEIG